jgi:outer membrane biosynthesis protein TonB
MLAAIALITLAFAGSASTVLAWQPLDIGVACATDGLHFDLTLSSTSAEANGSVEYAANVGFSPSSPATLDAQTHSVTVSNIAGADYPDGVWARWADDTATVTHAAVDCPISTPTPEVTPTPTPEVTPTPTPEVTPTPTPVTYCFAIHKMNGDTSINGAGFTLYASDETTIVAPEAFTSDGGILQFCGLSGGRYHLVETTAPAGYQAADPMDISIPFVGYQPLVIDDWALPTPTPEVTPTPTPEATPTPTCTPTPEVTPTPTPEVTPTPTPEVTPTPTPEVTPTPAPSATVHPTPPPTTAGPEGSGTTPAVGLVLVALVMSAVLFGATARHRLPRRR